jgi:hypothetical protein
MLYAIVTIGVLLVLAAGWLIREWALQEIDEIGWDY